ncbi:ABC-type Fe3+-hydroxamate transport system substrate-binding protein [Pelomonas saccharophila]|uniref:ABC-type Fe3+-hydroxamate transport system substrate-binding protein n=1 Tax=Roseateles saccharophilus TaxID=304 RepID=A0ABU1YN75_ROSSA|nr:helical backbone metal receptor [Roseateles saccharophilus]MDR7270309.1 ABC-type Fe3+-hydroxamate transport system substrate-binding protein [Roseateles saccharophilus]
MTPPRIASLVPSATETLVALGLGSRLVARTGFCIHPADAVKDVPKVGGTKDVNLAKLSQLAPTHVVVNIDENRLETAQALREFVPEVIVTHPRRPEDNLALFEQLRSAFAGEPGVNERAAALSAEFTAALARCRATPWPGEKVLYLIWRQPWMTVARDTYISTLLAEAGWRTWPDVLGGEQGAGRYPALTGMEPWLGDIDRVLLSSEPYRFDATHVAEAQALCPQARVQLVDGELLSWWGCRGAAGLDYLRSLQDRSPG